MVVAGSDGKAALEAMAGARPISLWLADVDADQIGSHAHAQLSHAVSMQCRQADSFSKRLQRQIFALQQIHGSMRLVWRDHDKLNLDEVPPSTSRTPSSTSSSSTSSFKKRNMRNEERGGSAAAASANTTANHGNDGESVFPTSMTPTARAGMSTLPATAHLGVFMFHTLLDCVNHPSADQASSCELLRTIVPMVHDLGLVSAAISGSVAARQDKVAAATPTGGSSESVLGTADGGHGYVLDALRNFLLRSSLPSSHECCILLKTDVLTSEELRAAGKMSVADRTAALAALVELAFVRGSLCDLLMAIRVMICVAWTEKIRESSLGISRKSGANVIAATATTLSKADAHRLARAGESVNNSAHAGIGAGMQHDIDKVGGGGGGGSGDDPMERVLLKGQRRGKKPPSGVVDVDDESKSSDIFYNNNGGGGSGGGPPGQEDERGVADVGGAGASAGVAVSAAATTASMSASTNNNQKQMRLMNAKKRQAATDPTNIMPSNNNSPLSGARMVAQAAVMDVRNNGHQISNDDPFEESWDGTQDIVVEPLLDSLPIVKFLRNIQNGSSGQTSARGERRAVGGGLKERSDAGASDDAVQENSALALPSEMWTFGQNSYGELVHGDTNSRTMPGKVDGIGLGGYGGECISQVAAGNEHTCVLTESGLVLMAGYNDNGQCGQGTTERVDSLTVIESLRDKHVVQVHAYNGCEHTLVVTRDGRLYAFGYNYRGQLGLGSTSSVFVPQLVRGLMSKKVRSVSCSYYHSMVSCADGTLFGMGRNDFGQIGVGDLVDRKEPTLVDLPGLMGTPAKEIACGQYHTLVLAQSGSAWVCGKKRLRPARPPFERNAGSLRRAQCFGQWQQRGRNVVLIVLVLHHQCHRLLHHLLLFLGGGWRYEIRRSQQLWRGAKHSSPRYELKDGVLPLSSLARQWHGALMRPQ